jgi:putative FmdB family regulatory protein
MPTYEYRCPQGHVAALLRPIADRAEPVRCPQCGVEAVRILSATFGVVRNPAVPRREKVV